MKPIATLALACLIATAGAAPTAFAETPPAPRPGDQFKKLDANGDGKLSRDEVRGRHNLERNFDAIDTNKDGFLSHEEVEAARKKAAAAKKSAAPDSPTGPTK